MVLEKYQTKPLFANVLIPFSVSEIGSYKAKTKSEKKAKWQKFYQVIAA